MIYGFLPLPLLETGVLFVDHVQLSFPAHDLAIHAPFFDRCSYFHLCFFICCSAGNPGFRLILFVPEYDPPPRQVVWTHFHTHLVAWQYPDIVHSHFPRNCGQYFMSVFQLHLEHCIGQCLYNSSILFDQRLFTHTLLRRRKDKIIWG